MVRLCAPLSCPNIRRVREGDLASRCCFIVVVMILHLSSLAIAIGTLAVKVDAVSAPGEIVCRYEAATKSEVNYYTCHELAAKYSITVEKFFQLNPAVDKDCDNIQPNTVYCVAGCKYFEQIYIDHANRWQSFNQ
jgi:hypothetical protein